MREKILGAEMQKHEHRGYRLILTGNIIDNMERLDKYVRCFSSASVLINNDYTNKSVNRCASYHIFGNKEDVGILLEHARKYVQQFPLDANIIKNDLYMHPKRLVVFDMDSTLIKEESFILLAKNLGMRQEFSRSVETAMQGKKSFKDSFTTRMKILAGTPANILRNMHEEFTISPGAKETIEYLNMYGVKTAIVSGSLDLMVEPFKLKLGVDYGYYNVAKVDGNDCLTGEYVEPLIDEEGKKNVVKMLMDKFSFSPNDVISIGDGANDIPMLKTSGMGVAYKAKNVVLRQTPFHIIHGDIYSLINFSGLWGSSI